MKTITVIQMTTAEVQSNSDRVKQAENLILQLPETHEGRNTWLLNYGRSEKAIVLRNRWELTHNRHLEWNENTESLKPVS